MNQTHSKRLEQSKRILFMAQPCEFFLAIGMAIGMAEWDPGSHSSSSWDSLGQPGTAGRMKRSCKSSFLKKRHFGPRALLRSNIDSQRYDFLGLSVFALLIFEVEIVSHVFSVAQFIMMLTPLALQCHMCLP